MGGCGHDGPGGRDITGKDFPELKFVIIAAHISKVGRWSRLQPIQGSSQNRIMHKEPSMKRTSKRYDSESLRYEIKFYW